MLDRDTLKRDIILIIADTAGVDKNKITEDKVLKNDLGLDSLDTIDLIMNLESKFKIDMYDDDIDSSFKVSDVINLIEREIKETENVKKKRNNKGKSTKT